MSAPLARPAPRSPAWLDRLGPAWIVVLGVTSLGVIPFGPTLVVDDRVFALVVADLDASLLVPVALVCTSALGFAAMGWSVRGAEARRACLGAGAQTLSYGVAWALAALPLALVHGSLDLVEIAAHQDTTLALSGVAARLGLGEAAASAAWPSLPAWGLVFNPPAVALVVVCGLGALRLPPFDTVAADAEARTSLEAEGSGLRLGTAVVADGIDTLLLAAFVVTLGLGGWSIPWLDLATLRAGLAGGGLGPGLTALLAAALYAATFAVKTIAVFALLRWIGRRLEPLSEDRMTFLCFRLLVPLALVNVFATGYWLVARPALS